VATCQCSVSVAKMTVTLGDDGVSSGSCSVGGGGRGSVGGGGGGGGSGGGRSRQDMFFSLHDIQRLCHRNCFFALQTKILSCLLSWVSRLGPSLILRLCIRHRDSEPSLISLGFVSHADCQGRQGLVD